ncbi:MAG: ACP S-malonyltransferase [Bdellovibrionales bacterium]|nr:ACP S-malonyltransferase [Bdellovibrionales bacterium]
MKTAAVFPGQGSQSVGMGLELFEGFDNARDLFERADQALGYSLTRIMFEGPIEELTLTKHTQPALLVCGIAAFAAADIPVQCAMGHSLGEYTALVAAGSLSFEDAVTLVHKRGTYMQEAVPQGAGSMLAIIGPNEAEIEELISQVRQGVCEVANYNCPGQTVVAGDKLGLADCSEIMAEKGIKTIPLNVSAPFHCSLMKPAADRLALDLGRTEFKNPKFPVYANVTAQRIERGEQARELLKQQVCSSVRWTESMQNLTQDLEVDTIIEFGSGAVLSKLQKRIDRTVKAYQVFDMTTLNQTQAALAG